MSDNTTTNSKGYTPAETQATQALSDQLMELTGAMHPKIAMTALLSAYMRHAQRANIVDGAAENLVAVGGGVLMKTMLAAEAADRDARTLVVPAAGRVH